MIKVVEGRESDGVIEWGVGMVLKGRGMERCEYLVRSRETYRD